MNTLTLAGIVLTLEFALIAWVLLFLLLRKKRVLAAQFTQKTDAGLQSVLSTENTRRAALADLFASKQGLHGEELKAKVNGYLDRERAFYQAMRSLYLIPNGEGLHALPRELTKVIDPLEKNAFQNDDFPQQIDNLLQDQAALTKELQETQETLTKLMEEYNAAFERSQKIQSKELQQAKIQDNTINQNQSKSPPATETLKFDLAEEFEIGSELNNQAENYPRA